ncbi:MAG: excinuclease ABC subunit UvrA [Thermoguttaceae bacterium]|jgi:excinuclease ABC subunit A
MKDIRRKKSDKSQNGLGVQSSLCICGVQVHNLKNVDVAIPWNKTTVLAGPSGSGKSSLAYDTIFAEGQRQYVESLSTYSRQFLSQLARPEIDSISGLQPTVAIKQISCEPDSLSTVATAAELYDFLRLLFAKVGIARCYKCGRAIQCQTEEQIAQTIYNLPEETRFIILAPIVHEKFGAHADVLNRLINKGRTRARIDGKFYELEEAPDLNPKVKHSIELVIDRLILREGVEDRLLDSIKSALKEGAGFMCCVYEKERQKTPDNKTRSIWKELFFSELYSCPKCNVSYKKLEPRSFSFNSPYGACRHCEGQGKLETFDPQLLVVDDNLSLADGALTCCKGKKLLSASQTALNSALDEFKKLESSAWDKPLAEWNEHVRDLFFFGSPRDDAREYDDEWLGNAAAETSALKKKKKRRAKAKVKKTPEFEEEFRGIVPLLEELLAKTKNSDEREFLNSFRDVTVCNECKGSRIRREAGSVTVADKTIAQVTAMTVTEALSWFKSLQFDKQQEDVALPIVKQILSRLEIMKRLRIEYLTLDRPSGTLSGGEWQRVRVTTALGANLSGVCYILDEPTTGLHPRDTEMLLDVFDSLKEMGNTVLLVEHDDHVIRRADWLIDFGPGAGSQGGEIVAKGTPDEVAKNAESPTGRFLSGKDSISVPTERRKGKRFITLEGVTTNNLKDVSLKLPLGVFVCVTGVSGSGKSSLINKTLVPALRRYLNKTAGVPYARSESDRLCSFKKLKGERNIDKLVEVRQTPIGRTARSNPATYSGIFDEVRKLFAKLPDSKKSGFKAGRFSFNISGGRCKECQGLGFHRVENVFLPDMYVVCPVCEGKRFNASTLKIRFKDKTIADVLDMSFDEAAEFFANHETLTRYIKCFQNVGLGYLTLGQSSSSLSGGEAQRVKLATELAKQDSGKTLYVLDEPTSGLHPSDVKKLLAILDALVERGNSVVVIEHSTDVMKFADWIVDMGSEGGEAGGQIVATGTPETIASLDDNTTGQFIKEALDIR